MISQKLKYTIDLIDRSEPTMTRRAALEGLKLRLEKEAPEVACLRCEDASFFLTWQPISGSTSTDEEWVPVLGRCGKFMHHRPLEKGGLAMLPAPHCSEFNSEFKKS